MTARYGILVQMAQLITQLFLDWRQECDRPTEPFSFLVPREVLSGPPDDDTGYLVTVVPIKKKVRK